jgi:type IV pilus assembly protein PilN
LINVNLLPKNLRRRREPGYWRLIAVLFPLLALGVLAFIQLTTNQTEARLQEEKATRQLQVDLLQDALREQAALQARQRQLNELIAIRDAVRDGRIIWSNELLAMLETLPLAEGTAQPRIAFNQLTMQALDQGARQQRVSNATYDGRDVLAEMSVQGTAISAEVLAGYIRALENSPLFGVSFQNAARDETTGLYQFNLTIGALAGGRP